MFVVDVDFQDVKDNGTIVPIKKPIKDIINDLKDDKYLKYLEKMLIDEELLKAIEKILIFYKQNFRNGKTVVDKFVSAWLDDQKLKAVAENILRQI